MFGGKSTVGIFALWVGSLILLIGLPIMLYTSNHDTSVSYETNIENLHKKSEIELSNYTMKIMEMVQVTDKYKSDLEVIIKASIEGRYGDDGSKALTSFIQENNLPLDSAMYLNIQNAIVAGRNEFKIHQSRTMEMCAEYKKHLGYFLSGTLSKMSGFPKMDMKHYCEPVSDKKTKEAFETKEQTPLYE